MNVPNGDGGFSETSGGSLAENVWQHVCAVYSASAQTVYVGGVQVGKDTTPSPKITVTADELRVGTRADGTNVFKASSTTYASTRVPFRTRKSRPWRSPEARDTFVGRGTIMTDLQGALGASRTNGDGTPLLVAKMNRLADQLTRDTRLVHETVSRPHPLLVPSRATTSWWSSPLRRFGIADESS